MSRPTNPHFRSGLFIEEWFAMSRELEDAAEEGRPPSGDVLYGLMVDAVEDGWQAGYSDGRTDVQSRHGLVELFENNMASAFQRLHGSGDDTDDGSGDDTDG